MEAKQKRLKKPGSFFGRILRSPLLNGVLDALPFGKVITNVKDTISSDIEKKHKNMFYLLSYAMTGVLMWLFISGKIDNVKMNYLFSFVQQLLN